MPAQTVIQLRRDTESNWISTNPTLASGEIGYDSTNNQLKIGNGTSNWTTLPYASGGASVGISETAPEDPETGDVWFSSAEGRAYIYYDSFWIDLNPGIAGPAGKFTVSATAPEDAVSGDGWFNSEVAKLFIYYDEFWVEATSNLSGPSGVISVNSPIVNSGSSIAANLSIDYNAVQYGKNAIINGGFDIWQRGIDFPNAAFGYQADRWSAGRGGFTTGLTISRQAGTPLGGTQYAARVQRVSGNTSTANLRLGTTFESVNSIPLAGQTVTLSFYARAGANYSSVSSLLNVFLRTGVTIDASNISPADTFGAGTVNVINQNAALTTLWQRFTYTGYIDPTATQIGIRFTNDPVGTAGDNDWYEVTGVQLEAGAVATPFKRNAPSIQAELAACQRYYFRSSHATSSETFFGFTGLRGGSSTALGLMPLPVEMRVVPTITMSGIQVKFFNGGAQAVTNTVLYNGSNRQSAFFEFARSGTWASDASAFLNGASGSFIDFSSEL
jgi:hypothetical protein